MFFKSKDIDKLLDILKIEDVVGEFIDLKKSGSNYKGLCPFHSDTNPSFMVNPRKNICKCFVCGSGGNPITFYSKYKKISFNEAVKELARKYNLNITQYTSGEDSDIYEKYYQIMQEAHNFYMRKIFQNESREALEYLSKRKMNSELIQEYQIGYATKDWDLLYQYLLSKNYTTEEIEILGLIKINENNKVYDTFRNRIIFPIFSAQGRVIAFGGRALENNENIPKYINSPDTPIFKKGKNLYGMERVRAIKEKNYAILMEGYMDVLTACSFGYETTLAPLGTALTIDQVRLLKKYTTNVLLSFDMDKAGLNAAEKAGYILKSEGFQVKVLDYEDAKDPDELFKKKGKNAFLKAVRESKEFFDFLSNLFIKEYDLNDILSKQNYIKRFKELFSNLKDSVERELYLKKLSELTQISLESLKSTLLEGLSFVKYKSEDDFSKENETHKKEKFILEEDKIFELEIIGMLLKKPIYYDFFKDKYFSTEISQKLIKFFDEKIKDNLFLESKNIIKDFKIFVENDSELKDSEDYDRIIKLILKVLDDDQVNEKENLEIFKTYFRKKLKFLAAKVKGLENKQKIVILRLKIEEIKDIENLIKIYNQNETLFIETN